jgi:hypothetical protein
MATIPEAIHMIIVRIKTSIALAVVITIGKSVAEEAR